MERVANFTLRPLCLRDKSPKITLNMGRNDHENRFGRLGKEGKPPQLTVIEPN